MTSHDFHEYVILCFFRRRRRPRVWSIRLGSGSRFPSVRWPLRWPTDGHHRANSVRLASLPPKSRSSLLRFPFLAAAKAVPAGVVGELFHERHPELIEKIMSEIQKNMMLKGLLAVASAASMFFPGGDLGGPGSPAALPHLGEIVLGETKFLSGSSIRLQTIAIRLEAIGGHRL